jgi:hypothetical protein
MTLGDRMEQRRKEASAKAQRRADDKAHDGAFMEGTAPRTIDGKVPAQLISSGPAPSGSQVVLEGITQARWVDSQPVTGRRIAVREDNPSVMVLFTAPGAGGGAGNYYLGGDREPLLLPTPEPDFYHPLISDTAFQPDEWRDNWLSRAGVWNRGNGQFLVSIYTGDRFTIHEGNKNGITRTRTLLVDKLWPPFNWVGSGYLFQPLPYNTTPVVTVDSSEIDEGNELINFLLYSPNGQYPPRKSQPQRVYSNAGTYPSGILGAEQFNAVFKDPGPNGQSGVFFEDFKVSQVMVDLLDESLTIQTLDDEIQFLQGRTAGVINPYTGSLMANVTLYNHYVSLANRNTGGHGLIKGTSQFEGNQGYNIMALDRDDPTRSAVVNMAFGTGQKLAYCYGDIPHAEFADTFVNLIFPDRFNWPEVEKEMHDIIRCVVTMRGGRLFYAPYDEWITWPDNSILVFDNEATNGLRLFGVNFRFFDRAVWGVDRTASIVALNTQALRVFGIPTRRIAEPGQNLDFMTVWSVSGYVPDKMLT